jgi:branched-chain amino acid transport system substrate-binding protein
MKKHLGPLMLFALLFTLLGCGANTASPASAIKIGAGYALTGTGAPLDQPTANGAKLAVKEINAAGGVLGRQLELIVRDGQTNKEATAKIATELVQQEKPIAVIGFSDTDSVLAFGPVIQQAGIPFITSGATSPKIPDQIGNMMFLAAFGDNVQAAAGAEFGFQQFGKTAALLVDKDVEYTTLLAGYFKARFTELGGTILVEDTYADDATDFAPQIEKLKALPQQPAFYYIAAMPNNVGLVVKQLRQAGLTGPIVGGDGYDTPDLIQVAGRAAENVFFTTHALVDSTRGTERIKKFIAAYEAEYGHQPENAFAALGYDSVYLLADAIKRAGATTPQAILQAIEATKNFDGTTGSISFSAASHVPQKGVTIIAVKDGLFTLGTQLVPEQVPAP